MIAGPPALLRIATLSFLGTGCARKAFETSNISSMDVTRITPHWANSAPVATSTPANAPVWDIVALAPASVLPALTAIIGLFLLIRLAILVNFCGFPKLSKYIRITSTFSSCSHSSMRSLPDISGLFPMLTNFESPIPRFFAWFNIDSPNAPDCDRKPILPDSGLTRAKLALSFTSSSVFMTPMQLGPTIRILYFRTSFISFSSSRIPAPPVSLNPAVMTTIPFTPFLPQSLTTFRTPLAGIAMTARSILSFTSVIDL